MAYQNVDEAGPTMTGGPRPAARLVVEYGPGSGQSFLLDKSSLIVGRSPECDVVLDDPEVSRRHTRFFWRSSQLMVEDLGSANGTLVNGAIITGQRVIAPDDKIEIGTSVLGTQGLPRVAAAPPAGQRSARPQPQPATTFKPAPAKSNNLGLILVIGVLLLIVFVGLLGAGVLFFKSFQQQQAAVLPAVTIVTPTNGIQSPVNAPLTVQATATDAQGVVRIELWADGVLVSQQASSSTSGESMLLLNIPWTPTIPGNHVLEVRAYNAGGQQNQPALVTINAVAAPAIATTAATAAVPATLPPTVTALPPTSTPQPQATATFTSTPAPTTPPEAQLQTSTGVNVRTGPGTGYPLAGALAGGQVLKPLGRSPDGNWWQIIYPVNSGSVGWVSGSYVVPNDTALSLPVVAPPPLPPTATFTPTPTATSSPTPTPTSTALASADISFTVDNANPSANECTKLRWRVKNVKAYWVDGTAEAGDEGSKKICDPQGTTTHVLRVKKLNDTYKEYAVVVTVGDGGVSTPEMVSPDNNKEFNYYPREVTFVWSSVSAADTVTYNIEVQWYGGDSWETYLRVESLSSPTYTMDNFVGANPGRWRVWATSSSAGDSSKTDWRYFRFLQ